MALDRTTTNNDQPESWLTLAKVQDLFLDTYIVIRNKLGNCATVIYNTKMFISLLNIST